MFNKHKFVKNFAHDEICEIKRPLLPHTCILSGKTLWWDRAVKITHIPYYDGECTDTYWADEQEFMWWKLKQED